MIIPISADEVNEKAVFVIEKTVKVENLDGTIQEINTSTSEISVNPKLRYSVTESQTKNGYTVYAILNYENLTSNPNDLSCSFYGNQWVKNSAGSTLSFPEGYNFSNNGSHANYLQNENVNTSFVLTWSIPSGNQWIRFSWTVYAKSITK